MKNAKRIISLLLSLVCLIGIIMSFTGCETIETLMSKLNGGNQGEDQDGEKNPPVSDGEGEDNISDGVCQHDLAKLPWAAPTCSTEGKKGAFECKDCNKLFAYSAEKDGLVEISEQEIIPRTDHVIGDGYSVRVKPGVDKVSSFEDYEIVSTCKNCGEGFVVGEDSLKGFAPSTKMLYDDVTPVSSKRELVDGVVSTTYNFSASTKANVHNWVYHNDDSGELGANSKLPFSANTDRYLILFVKNNSSESVTFKYGAEYWSNYCWSDSVRVEGNSYSAFVLKINFSGSDYASYHTIQFLTDLSGEVSLTFGGFYIF